jgi:hypothetical protein
MLQRPLLAGNQDEQSFDLGDGHRDQTGVGGWLLVGPDRQDRWWRLGFSVGRGDSAHGHGNHGEHDMT